VPDECGGTLYPAAGVTGGSGVVETGFLPRRIVPRVEAGACLSWGCQRAWYR